MLIWLLLPLWLPLVLRPATARYGIQYQDYQHKGLRAFTVKSASFTNQTGTLRVSADRLEVLAPSTWVFRLLSADSSEPFLKADGWTVHVRTNAEPKPSSPGSMYTNVLDVRTVSRALDRWIPVAVLSNGSVRVPGFDAGIAFGVWSNGVLHAQAKSPSVFSNAVVDVAVTPADVTRFALRSSSIDAQVLGQVSTTTSGLRVQGSGSWHSNKFELNADFARASLLPQTGKLHIPDFRVPSEMLGATNYPDVVGSLNATWNNGEFALDLMAGTTYLNRTSPPPIHVTLSARGDTNTAVVHSATLNSSWLNAELSRDLVLHFTGPKLLEQSAFMRVSADLSRQDWLPVTGLVQGDATFAPVEGKLPAILFRVSGMSNAVASIDAQTLDVAGGFLWPLLNVTALSATLADNSHAEATGTLNLESKTVSNGRLVFTGPFGNRWLPQGSGYEALSATAEVRGSFTNLTHNGSLDVTNFTTAGIRPLSAHANWSGQGLTSFSAKSLVKTRASSVAFDGTVEMQPGRTAVLVKSLTLNTNDKPLMQLRAPFPLVLSKVSTNTVISLEPLRLSGAGGELDAHGTVAWPNNGALNVAARNVSTGFISDFVEEPVPEIAIKHLETVAGWTNGPIVGHVTALASGYVPVPDAQTKTQMTARARSQRYPLTAELDVWAGPNRISISNLLVTTRTSTVATATGSLPVGLSPTEPKLVNLLTNEPMQMTALVTPEGVVWRELEQRFKVQLANPHLRVDAAGTFSKPNAKIHLTSPQLRLLEAGPQTPTFTGLDVTANVQPDRAKADVQLLVQGLPITATGEIPLDNEFWAAVRKKEMPSLAKASARLNIRDSELALVAGLYPTLFAPQGEIVADISLLPGGKLQGDLMIEHARTRPFPSVGPLRDINLGISLLDQSAVQTATARVGGSPVYVQGSFDLSGTQWLHGKLPPFKLTLTGTNVPLSRKPESIIRSDLDLTVAKTNGAPPLITGDARLRNSFYLSDVRALLPSGGGSAPSRRPPYFSIDDPFFADWRLAVHVTGDRFLKIRSTLFNGEASGNLRLQGTLENPMALGDLKIASGSIRFPFATLEVQQGFVTLGSQDPYRPQLSLSATSKQFGYDIRMDANGPADQPLLQFSSTPPLGSEQIVLMLTAGQVPREQQVYSTVQRAQTFALFLGRDLLAQLGLGDNSQDRLTVRSGEQISETGRPTYNIEYKLTPTWSVTGEYDRFNEYNVGLKWKVYSK